MLVDHLTKSHRLFNIPCPMDTGYPSQSLMEEHMPKKQYYKIVDTQAGHHGFFYQVGLNVDPNPVEPIERVGSCRYGALYFVDIEHLPNWASVGDSVAWVTPRSKFVKDGDKYKAHKLEVTRLLPFKKALPILLTEGLRITDAHLFGIKVTGKQILADQTLTPVEKLEWFLDNGKDPFPLVAKYMTDEKFMINLREESNWTLSQCKRLIKMGADDALSTDDIIDLVRHDEYKLVASLINKNPKRYIDILTYGY